METKNILHDIAKRCDGDIYLGVVGPVRSGKSSFIKRFMEKQLYHILMIKMQNYEQLMNCHNLEKVK